MRRALREIIHYPSAVAGLVIIIVLMGVAVYAVATIPYGEATRLWRGGPGVWDDNPKNAPPVWFNLFYRKKRPVTMVLSVENGKATKKVEPVSDEVTEVTISFPFEYQYDDFPQEVGVYFNAKYKDKRPGGSMYLITPDGREIRVTNLAIRSGNEKYIVSQDTKLKRRLGKKPPEKALFADPNAEELTPLKGQYELQIRATVFEKDSDLDAKLVIYGQLCGWAGTDHLRRDLGLALLFGTPTALAFGLLAAMGTTFTTMAIAGISTWYGGWVDMIIQRITEVNMILPTLPILIMIGTFYSRSIWLMLGVIILLSVFGSAIKTYRAVFIQVKESPYIEAARAYGAGSWRIIFRYLIPRIVPMLIPGLVTMVPSFVFLESALAVLGLGDPVLPTWGKVINDAHRNGALYQGLYYWVMEPAALLMVTGLGFSLLGFALDRVFNPRLRGI